MGVRRAQDETVRRVGVSNVLDEPSPAPQQPEVLEPARRLADGELAHLDYSP